MGYMRHHAIVVTDNGYGDVISQAHDKALVLGLPVSILVDGVVNHVRSFAILPDGSKEGWAESNVADVARGEIVKFLRSLYREDGSSPLSWAEIQFGDDEHDTKVLGSSDDDRKQQSTPATG